MKPYDYQEKDINNVLELLKTKQKVLLQEPTGAGKTIIFSFLVRRWLEENSGKKVVICVHREELLKQTLKSLRKLGVTCESVTAGKKTLNHLSDVYVCMVETLYNRLNDNPNYLPNIGLGIDDECHIRLYEKIFDFFPNVKRLGVTATPISNKKISFSKCTRCGNVNDTPIVCCNVEMFEYSRKFSFSEIYDDIVTGVQVSELIEKGFLTKDVNYSVGHIDRSKLSIDAKTGDFDVKSSESEYANDNALIDVVLNYEELAKGKKTLIFNPSIKMNELVYQMFLNRGYTTEQVKVFDSKNKEGGRDFILNWFKNTDGAILINAGILTAGYDEDTIEAVIMNRATVSFALYLQCIGRGGRITDKFFKQNFIHIDLGGNIEYFKNLYQKKGLWSDAVDWRGIFFGDNDKPRPKKEPLENIVLCENCGNYHSKSLLVCDSCGFEKLVHRAKKTLSNEVASLIDDYPLPDGYKIVQYVKKNEKDLSFAYTLLINSTVDLFIYKYVTRGSYEKSLGNGQFYDSLKKIFAKPMKTFAVSFERKNMRTFEILLKSVKNKLDAFYSVKKEDIKPIVIITKI